MYEYIRNAYLSKWNWFLQRQNVPFTHPHLQRCKVVSEIIEIQPICRCDIICFSREIHDSFSNRQKMHVVDETTRSHEVVVIENDALPWIRSKARSGICSKIQLIQRLVFKVSKFRILDTGNAL